MTETCERCAGEPVERTQDGGWVHPFGTMRIGCAAYAQHEWALLAVVARSALFVQSAPAEPELAL